MKVLLAEAAHGNGSWALGDWGEGVGDVADALWQSQLRHA